ncbi:hypothetical protein GGE24_001139 [Bradyrhizobium centrosematis]|nr:hypothetical protein [Bradyrhizobium centrosematis]MCS3771827.1 hypothetical protein [Bradyrhizobium centrosematis]
MHRAAAQEEQGGGRIARGDDLRAGLKGPDRADRGEIRQLFFVEAFEQRLLGKLGGLVEIDRAAIAVDNLVFRPFDRGI